MLRIVVLLLGLTLSLLTRTSRADSAIPPEAAPPAPLNERVLDVPVSAVPPVRLKVTLFMPSRGGPFPLVLVNHGASPIPADAPRVGDNFIPYYFLSRGYAVAMPMMRGYAGSDGQLMPHGCDIVALGLDASHDIRKVLDYVKQQPGIDASHIVMAGKSMGGWNTLVFGSLAPDDVKGLISFAGGVKESDCRNPDASLISGAQQLGARTKLHSIWFFGENDQIFTTSTWRAMFRQYTAAGAHAELVDYGAFQKDAHAMTASAAGLPLWVQRADTFLASIGMPSQEVDPEYLPQQARATSAYADINDFSALPYLNAQQRDTVYRDFLAAPLPRAIAIGATTAVWSTGGFDPGQVALDQCWKQTQYCQLYAVDNTVVWPKLDGQPPASRFAALSDVAAVPYLNAQGRQAYSLFLGKRNPRAFAIAPDGAWGAGQGVDPINDALVACGNGHTDCRLYAVNRDVVWVRK
ncbi:dienelactone hydrolase family protein [Paraburkholderia sp. BCC1885]|uniref:dienelactone hydrolase family protein n=1 Tax=Paraburkholderia sp. BCC1885 TaxID=2562669 RepID=UPI0016434D7D|nr:CocE/NonD family hydrolase [Paraburkholderia sp. BCC1885]